MVLAQSILEAAPALERHVERRCAQLGVAEGVVDALSRDEVLVVARVADQSPAGAEGLAEVAADRRADEALLALCAPNPVGKRRSDLERLEEGGFDVLSDGVELVDRTAGDDQRQVVVRGPRRVTPRPGRTVVSKRPFIGRPLQ